MNHSRRYLLAVLAAAVVAGAAQPGATEEKPDIKTFLESVRQKHNVPALAAAKIARGKITDVAAVGDRKYGEATPAMTDDRFHLGSCTKSMTATVAARLVEQGKIAWTTTLAERFPELKSEMHPDYRDVTLKQLLSNRGGMAGETYPKGGPDWHREGGALREQRSRFVGLALKEAPAAPPGTKFIYSNRGFIIAGAMLERAADMGWEDLMRRQLFEPLGMKTAGFGPMGTREKVDQPRQHVLRDGKHQALYADNAPVLGPAGTVHCSIGDFAKYAAFHIEGDRGPGRLLKAESFQLLHTPPYPTHDPGGDYALGWGRPERGWAGGATLTHSGSNTMSFAVMWLAPKRDFGVVVATNQGGDPGAKACDEVSGAVVGELAQRLGK